MPGDLPPAVTARFGLQEATRRPIGYWVARNATHHFKLAPLESAAARRIRREAALLARLRVPGVPEGRDRSDEAPGWAVAEVRSAPGRSLLEWRDTLSREDKDALLRQLEERLAALNAAGVLHADVNAGNVFWDGRTVTLIDFEEARRIEPPLDWRISPDRIGGPPCCAGPDPYGYHAVHCLAALRAWLLLPEFDAFSTQLPALAVWNPASAGNTCLPETTPDDGSVYQTVAFGPRLFRGQRDPLLRFQYLLASRVLSFRGRRVLDVGCNLGRLSALLDRHGIERYVGLEVNRGYWEAARELARFDGNERAEFVLGDICDPPTGQALMDRFPDGFDVCVCQSVYHHLPDKAGFLDRLAGLGCLTLIFEGPVDRSVFLIGADWEEEKAQFAQRGFRLSYEAWDNDYQGRVLGVFARAAAGRSGG